jgi:hypothetical protein
MRHSATSEPLARDNYRAGELVRRRGGLTGALELAMRVIANAVGLLALARHDIR